MGLQDNVCLGNLDAYRDWGHAKDYVQAMWLMLQQDCPEDFIISTGVATSVRQALEYVCSLADLNMDKVYKIDKKYMRPAEVPYLKGNSEKARRKLNWLPSYDWKSLLKEMYEHDLSLLINRGD